MFNRPYTLDNAMNVEFKEMLIMKEYGGLVPVYSLEEPSATVWNAKAERINTKSFIKAHGRDPKNYEEVKKWVNSLINKENHSAANTMASDS